MLNLRLKRRTTLNRDSSPSNKPSLAALANGSYARIACVECPNAARCARLMAYGLVQGQIIQLVQSQPAYVIRVDETELALDEEVARCVRVEPLHHL